MQDVPEFLDLLMSHSGLTSFSGTEAFKKKKKKKLSCTDKSLKDAAEYSHIMLRMCL